HELVKVGLVADRRFDFGGNVFRRVMFQADNRRALHSYSVFAKLSSKLANIRSLQLAIAGLWRVQTHPNPGNAEFDEFQHGVFANGVGGSKNGKFPALARLLHAFQQTHGARTVEQEIFVHHKKGMYVEFRFDVAHHVKQFVAGLVKVDKLSFTAEKSGSGAEVAAHGTAHRRDECCCCATFSLRQAYTHDARLKAGDNSRMPDGGVLVFAQVAAHPGNTFSAHDVVGVNHGFQAGNGGNVSTDHDYRIRR